METDPSRGTKSYEQWFGLDQTHHPSIPWLLNAGKWFCNALRSEERAPRWLAISGSPGCGKTKVARGIYRFSMSHGPDIIARKGLVKWASAWINWRSVAEADDEDDFKDALFEVRECSLLVMDDLGAETDRYKSGVPISRLRQFLAEIERKWIILTSNQTLAELTGRYDSRVVDRLRAFEWLELGEVPSYRPKLKNKLK